MNASYTLNDKQLNMLVLGLGLATFVQVFDVAVSNVAVHQIAVDFAEEDRGLRVVTLFAAGNGVAILLSAWLIRRFGEVPVGVWAIGGFAAASLLAGLAWSFEVLCLARLLQGLAVGPIIPLSQGMLLGYVPAERRAWALATWSGIAVAAPVFGPAIGGWVLEAHGWQWVFLINIPICLLALFWILRATGYRRHALPAIRLDWLGLLLVSAAVLLLQMLAGPSDVPEARGLYGAALVLVVACFCFWERRVSNPLVSFQVMADRNFAFVSLVMAIGYALFYCSLVLVPVWLQKWQGLGAAVAGMLTVPVGLAPLLLSSFFARRMACLSVRHWAALSLFMFAVTSWCFGLLAAEASLWDIALFRLLQGFALLTFYVPLLSMAVARIAPENMNEALSLITFFRYGLGSVLVPLGLGYCEARSASYLASREPSLAGEDFSAAAFSHSVGDFFVLSAVLFFLLGLSVFLATRTGAKADA